MQYKQGIIATLAAATLAMHLCGCTSQEAKKVIDEIDNLGPISLESADALEEANADYESLSDEEKAEVDNLLRLESANNTYNQLLTRESSAELEKTDELFEDYFSSSYDTTTLLKLRDALDAASESDDLAHMRAAYDALAAENNLLANFLLQEGEANYTEQTGAGTHPFKVSKSELPEEWNFSLLRKQTAKTPRYVSTYKEYTDKPAYLVFSGEGTSYGYSFKIKQVNTKEIVVENEDGAIQQALVNTEVRFAARYDGDKKKALNERPGYLFRRASDGMLMLALESYDGEDFYVLYT